ncbi:chaperone protein dnaJ 11, chloroplastic-like [Iris pallida]|uniref:Chaperone protein dnaJ 11, chloroplastic-like n=1 Tax=Iris pallida TaxID=29817 RepID=A0AAX6E7J1_IRIPA|nr:chaperone protein dnaJ 11, chloroplastic-like [Iris pallida]
MACSSSTIAFSGFGSGSAKVFSRPDPARRQVAARAGSVAAGRRGGERSLYEVLRVEETASVGEIKAAYRTLAKRFHPDVDPDGNGSEFLEIRRAYSTLSDAEEREMYDRSLTWRVGFCVEPRMRVRRRWETDQCW